MINIWILLIVFSIVIINFIYMVSYAKWTWKDNKLGAFMLIVVALSVLILPIYTLLFRH